MADHHHGGVQPTATVELTYGPQDYPETASQLRTLDTSQLLGDALRVNDLFSNNPQTSQQFTAPTQVDILHVLLPIFDTALTARNQLAQMTRSFPAHQNAAFQNHQALVHVHWMIDNMTQAMQMFTHHNQAGIEEVTKGTPVPGAGLDPAGGGLHPVHHTARGTAPAVEVFPPPRRIL